MKIEKRCYTPNFNAKFIQSDDLKKIADYAVEHGKFEKLNQARKNIDSLYLRKRIYVYMGQNEKGYPFVNFTVFEPKKFVVIPSSNDDYVKVKTVQYLSAKKCNPLLYAFKKIIKLSNNAPHNKMFQNLIISKKAD